MTRSVLVLGAGMVGVSVALHLRLRGFEVALVDRSSPGSGATFGNAGLIQREATHPAAFPRSIAEILRIARNRSIDVSYHPQALPGLAAPLLRYWMNSAPSRYAAIVRSYAVLIRECLAEHEALARQSMAEDLLRPTGYLRVFEDHSRLEEMASFAEDVHRLHDVGYRVLSGSQLAAEEPHLLRPLAGAIHWTDAYSVPDPQMLTQRYADRFVSLGGRLLIGDAQLFKPRGSGWSLMTQEGTIEATSAVIALGAASALVTRPLGYSPPTFAKRGYHRHYRLRAGTSMSRPIMHHEKRVMMVPMRAGIRLTTGIEFVRPNARSTPVQLARAEPVARSLLPLEEPIEDAAWFGLRPASADMLPIIGRIPGQRELWAAFGHGHQGLTLGPVTGRLLSEMMSGETPYLDPAPFSPARFS